MEPQPTSRAASNTERRGRKPRAEAAGRPFLIRLSPAERERLKYAARVNGQQPADFARDALVTAADECLESGTGTAD
jgi:uncharacterized protein (DUF1778 family)